MEKTAVCDIINETLPIGAGDICKPSGGGEKEIYSGDIFLPRDSYSADYYSPSAGKADEAILRRRGFMLINTKKAIERIMAANPAKLSSVMEDIREQAFKNGQGPKERLHLSSDKILFCFENDLKPEIIENFKTAVDSKLRSMTGDVCGIRISFLNSSSLKETPSAVRHIIRLLRIADFIGALYKVNCASEFNCQTYRKYGLYNYYCARYEKALELFLQCERLFKQPPDFRLYQNAGSLACKLGKTGLAIKYFTLAEMLDGSSAVPKANLGLVYTGEGAFEKAASYYRQCLELDPGRAEFHNNLAYNLLRLNKDLKEALEHSKKAVELSTASQLSNFADTLAAAFMHLKNYKKAADTYRLSLRASGSRTAPDETYLGLAEALLKSGDGAAARLVRKALKDRPELSSPCEPV
jgi:tetratricopeptide (TPR) repeat protein